MDKMARMFPKGGFSVPSAAKAFDVLFSGVVYGCPLYFMWRTVPLLAEGYDKAVAARRAIRTHRRIREDDGAVAQPACGTSSSK